MAIREVLTSFTFEQQRQMINLIGTDVGDASTLLTPTNVLVSGINEIVNGDVDLVNQTHGMDVGSLASPSLYWDAGQGFYKVDANKIGLSTGLAIAGNLEVDGDITFRAGAGSGGTLTFGDLNTDRQKPFVGRNDAVRKKLLFRAGDCLTTGEQPDGEEGPAVTPQEQVQMGFAGPKS